ncbi:MAG: hypothetical protein ACYTGW_16305 [Planctomycetota bacterium]|jgi:hypothetical protein
MDKTTTRWNVREQGFVMVTLFTLLVPLLIIVVAFTATMAGRTNELRVELDEELALLAAESGVDDAIYQGRTGDLKDGVNYGRNLGRGQSFEVEPTYLMDDGKDNDNDTKIDEEDEDVFQVVVTGTYRGTSRRLAAYLGPVPLLPTIEAAVTVQDPSIELRLNGTPWVSGNNRNMDDTPGAGADLPGLGITPPGTLAQLISELNPTEQSKVVGTGGAPSLANANDIDLVTLVTQIQNIADVVLTANVYASYNFGHGPSGAAKITYRNGDVTFTGNTRGAGILVVTGDLYLKGTFRYDGVVIVLGQIVNSAGTAQVYGAILQGPSGGKFEIKGTMDVYYSEQAVALANSVSGRYVAFIGWQELAR